MHYVDSPGFVLDKDGNPAFSDGNPLDGIKGTIFAADMANSLTREIIAVIVHYGLKPDKGDDRQLLKVLQGIVGPWWALNWQSISNVIPSGTIVGFIGIAYDQPRHTLLALDRTGFVCRSTDLINFSQAEKIFDLVATDLVAVGNGAVVASGSTSGGAFLQISSAPGVWSTIGSPFGAGVAAIPYSLVWGGGILVYAGIKDSSPQQVYLATITNLMNPEPIVTLTLPFAAGLPLVAHNGRPIGSGAVWLASLGPGALYRSTDGLGWDQIPAAAGIPVATSLTRVDWIQEQKIWWAADGANRRYWVSPDGLHWARIDWQGNAGPAIAAAGYWGGLAVVDAAGYLGVSASPYSAPIWTELPLLGPTYSSDDLGNPWAYRRPWLQNAGGVIVAARGSRVAAARDPVGEGWRIAGIPGQAYGLLGHAAGRWWAAGRGGELYASQVGW